MPTDPNMTGLIYPTEGDDPDIWDTIMNTTCWPVIGAHDHTFGKGVPVPIAGLLANADWLFSDSGVNYAISDLKAIGLVETPPADVAGFLGALFISAVDSNLYYRTVSGVNVKIIDGSTLNVSIVGGIGGDYSAAQALFDYDDATDTYRARQEEDTGVRQYAKLGIADLIIREYDPAGDATVPAEAVTIKSPDALAASYALTLLTALPASTSVMQVSATGALTASNSLPTQNSFSLAADANITLSGNSTGTTGVVKHGNRLRPQMLDPVLYSSGSPAKNSNLGGSGAIGWVLDAGTHYFEIKGLTTGERLKSVTIYGTGPLTGVATATYDVMVQVGSALTAPLSVAPSTVSDQLTVTFNLDGSGATIGGGDTFFLKVVVPGGETYGLSTIVPTVDRA